MGNISNKDKAYIYSFSLDYRSKKSYFDIRDNLKRKLSRSYNTGRSIVEKILNGNKKYNYCLNRNGCCHIVYRNKLCYNHYYIKYLRVISPHRKSRLFVNSSRRTHMTNPGIFKISGPNANNNKKVIV